MDLLDAIPGDHARQVAAFDLVSLVLKGGDPIRRILDFGCGAGSSASHFAQVAPSAQWIGLDIASSPEVSRRTQRRFGESRCTYDGTRIPFAGCSFDLVYSNQVFEHVRRPGEVLPEIERVLQSSGHFVGSTSYLEPYHSLSLWNYTPFGFVQLLEEAGFATIQIRPGIDAFTLITRNSLGSPRFFDRWWATESPLNRVLSLAGRLGRKDATAVNRAKLQFCGQFCFWARKP